MNTRRTLATARRVLLQLRNDPRTVAMLLVVPCVLILLLKYVFDGHPQIFDSIGAPMLGIFPMMVFLMGLFGFASVPGFITRVTDHAHGVPLAASANVSASNVGNALGAWLGGFAISIGLGYTAPLYVGAAIVLAGLAVMTVAARRSDQQTGHSRKRILDIGEA